MMIFLLILCVILLILIAAALLRSGWEQKHFIVREYSLPAEGAECGFRAAVLADLHEAVFGRENEELIRAIDRFAPDLILIPGDFITCRRDTETAEEPDLSLLRTLASRYPVYYAPGNHEENYLKLHPEYADEVADTGAVFLVDKMVTADLGSSIVHVSGITLGEDYYVRGKQPQMPVEFVEEKLGPCPEEYTILLAHNPGFFKTYARWGCNCVISGHNHGGVIRLPLLGGVMSASMHLFDRYDRGIFKEGRSTMVLSAGLGMHTIHVRLFNRPELVVISFGEE
ncbi:MAG: metallophosphoesterase [Lachnospiraceae bacterium]|nr:metallophosphoesterase [Lachnospiraceae bacterium]